MKKLQLSRFDLGFIIAFVVVAVLGAGAWWVLSSQLQSAQQEDARAKSDFDKYSSAGMATSKDKIIVNQGAKDILDANIKVLTDQLKPLIQTKLQPPGSNLSSIQPEDPVAWKHDLDETVRNLTDDAKVRGVTLPKSFYFGFSHYLNQSPNDSQTAVLHKQLDGIKALASILIDAPVKGVRAVRRTYEEEPHSGSTDNSGTSSDPDRLHGFASTAAGNTYIDYPFEVEFDTSSENLRTVINNLLQSPYVFVVRAISVKNSVPTSPLLSGQDKLAGPPPTPDSTAPKKGPQFLFGNSMIMVKARIDMIEWKADLSQLTPNSTPASAHAPGQAAPHKTPPSPAPSSGGNR
jgi:hypothetical protein